MYIKLGEMTWININLYKTFSWGSWNGELKMTRTIMCEASGIYDNFRKTRIKKCQPVLVLFFVVFCCFFFFGGVSNYFSFFSKKDFRKEIIDFFGVGGGAIVSVIFCLFVVYLFVFVFALNLELSKRNSKL